MSQQRMYRSDPEYKALMKRVMATVNLPKRSSTFKLLYEKLDNKHQDTLCRLYVHYLNKSLGEPSVAERKAINQMLINLIASGRARQNDNKEIRNYAVRTFSALLGINKDWVNQMSADTIESALRTKGILTED